MNIKTEEYIAEWLTISVSPGADRTSLSVTASYVDDITGQSRMPFSLYDAEYETPPRSSIVVNGKSVSRAELIEWFKKTNNVRLSIDTDEDAYSVVTEARFTGNSDLP
jgi:hypothetical protein